MLAEAGSRDEAECSEGWQLVDMLARTLRAMDWVVQGQALRSLALVVPGERRPTPSLVERQAANRRAPRVGSGRDSAVRVSNRQESSNSTSAASERGNGHANEASSAEEDEHGEEDESAVSASMELLWGISAGVFTKAWMITSADHHLQYLTHALALCVILSANFSLVEL